MFPTEMLCNYFFCAGLGFFIRKASVISPTQKSFVHLFTHKFVSRGQSKKRPMMLRGRGLRSVNLRITLFLNDPTNGIQ